MSWNYRVIRSEDDGGISYAIHECHYVAKGETIPHTWTKEPVPVLSETRTGLFWVVAVMTEGIGQPILEIQDGKLVEVEPVRELTDDLTRAIKSNKEFAEGMVSDASPALNPTAQPGQRDA